MIGKPENSEVKMRGKIRSVSKSDSLLLTPINTSNNETLHRKHTAATLQSCFYEHL